MKIYVASLAIGLLIGIIYASFGVRSPAPPIVSLLGLLGILAGEQLPIALKNITANVAARHAFASPVKGTANAPEKTGD
jgi:XapX domain-containing protein